MCPARACVCGSSPPPPPPLAHHLPTRTCPTMLSPARARRCWWLPSGWRGCPRPSLRLFAPRYLPAGGGSGVARVGVGAEEDGTTTSRSPRQPVGGEGWGGERLVSGTGAPGCCWGPPPAGHERHRGLARMHACREGGVGGGGAGGGCPWRYLPAGSDPPWTIPSPAGTMTHPGPFHPGGPPDPEASSPAGRDPPWTIMLSKAKHYGTGGSRVIPQPSTNPAQRSLTSEF